MRRMGLVGFDNAHPVTGPRGRAANDHRHYMKTMKPYEYRSAAELLADFWAAVDAELKRRGVTP